jgi:hypothetical protein
MSNQRRIRADNGPNRSARNLQVLLGRGMAEHQPGQVNVVTVKHDDWCPGLKKRSMLWCECNPEMDFNQWLRAK